MKKRDTLFELIEEEEAFNKTLMDASPTFIVTIDLNGKVLSMNRKMLETLKYDSEEILGMDYISTFVPPADQNSLRDIFEKIISKGEETMNVNRIISKSGEIFLIEWHGKIVSSENFSANFFLGIGIDITERKKTEQDLAKARNLEMLRRLAGGIAHDFNTLLMIIMGNAEIILTKTNDRDITKKTQAILEQIEKGARLTKNLLSFSQERKNHLTKTNPEKIIEALINLFSRDGKSIIHKKETKKIPPIEMDWEEFLEALSTLIKYLLEKNNLLEIKTIFSNNEIEILISGEKEMISRENLFEPFAIGKIGMGANLDLAAAKGSIENNGGKIEITHFGFSINFPIKKIDSKKILFIDDDKSVLFVGKEMLTSIGCVPITSNSGEKALEEYAKISSEIDLVMLDIQLMDISSKEIIEKIKKINPQVKILLFSGYGLNEEIKELLRACDGFIQKPFGKKDLADKIEEILK